MVSPIATKLIELPHLSGEAADMLWRYATLTDVKRSRTPISEALATELATFLDGAVAENFARLIPDTATITVVNATNPSAAVRNGLVNNPLTSDADLHALSTYKGCNEPALRRLSARQRFRDALAGNGDLVQACSDLVQSQDAHPFTILTAEQLTPLLATMTDTEFRSIILDACPSGVADEVRAALLGVLQGDGSATVIDGHLAGWVCDSTSLRAEATRDKLLSDRRAREEILGKLDEDARSRFATHDDLWVVVQRRIRVHAPTGGHAHPLDRSMLHSMRLAGMGVAEISALILNSRLELEPAELAEQLRGIDPIRLAGFFLGRHQRHPRPGDIDALVADLDPFQQHELAEQMDGDISDLPWRDELIVGIPRRFREVTDLSESEVIDRLLRHELGTDAKAWEVVLSMAEEWEGNLRSLVDAARQL